MKLKEAISHDTIDNALKRMKEPIESKLKGDIGKYVFSLETLLDMLADTSPKSDSEFLSMMKAIERQASRASFAPGRKKKATKGEPELPPEAGTEKGMPSLSSLAARDIASTSKEDPETGSTKSKSFGGDKGHKWKDFNPKKHSLTPPRKETDQEVDRRLMRKKKSTDKFWGSKVK